MLACAGPRGPGLPVREGRALRAPDALAFPWAPPLGAGGRPCPAGPPPMVGEPSPQGCAGPVWVPQCRGGCRTGGHWQGCKDVMCLGSRAAYSQQTDEETERWEGGTEEASRPHALSLRAPAEPFGWPCIWKVLHCPPHLWHRLWVGPGPVLGGAAGPRATWERR